MNRYSVMLVDDEEEVIQIIRKKMDWETMGFYVTGYAHNGVEALEMAEEQQPDVVMTDIKMPYMDGLELSRKLKEKYPTIKVVIFSGFDEFEYAKEAIKIEAEEYLLKPVDLKELQNVFEKIRNALDRDLDEKRNVDLLQQYYMESLPMLQESFYTSLIEGRLSREQLQKGLNSYQINLTGPYYVVTILHISTTNLENNTNAMLMSISVKRLVDEQLQKMWGGRSIHYLGDIVILSEIEDVSDIKKYADFMDEFCRQAKHVCGAAVTAGIGYPKSDLMEIHSSWMGARSAVSYRAIYGNTRAINITEIDPGEESDEMWEEQAIQDIMKQLRMGSEESLEQKLSDCLNHFSMGGTSLYKYRIFLMELMAELSRISHESRSDINDMFGKIQTAESPEELLMWLLPICRNLREEIQGERQKSTRSLVDKAEEYVMEHYSDGTIAIEDVCRELAVSAAYFSAVFKKETGKTFVSYLTDYRMDKAQEMLLTTELKTYQIAEQIGYTDANYFSYVFKKKFGSSPSRYRKKEGK